MHAVFIDLDETGRLVAGPFEEEDEAIFWAVGQLRILDPAEIVSIEEDLEKEGICCNEEILRCYEDNLGMFEYFHVCDMHTPEQAAELIKKNTEPTQ